MPRSTVEQVDETELYPLPEDTIFTAQLVSCVEDSFPFTYKQGPKAGQSGLFVKWKWTFVIVDDGQYKGIEVTGSTEPKITSATEPYGSLALARTYVEALYGQELEIGQEVDTDDLIGLQVKITVRHLPKRPRKNGDGYWYNVEVADIFPLFGNGQSVQQMASAPAAPEYGQPPY